MKKVLIIRFSSIGDIVLTTPIIRCVKEQTNAEVHFLTKLNYKKLIINNVYVDKVHTLDNSLQEVIDLLKDEGFDTIIDLHKNARTRRIKQQLKGDWYSYNKLNFKKWLFVNFKINLLPKIHLIDRYFQGIKELNIADDTKGLDYFLPSDIGLDDEIKSKLNSNYTVLSIGGTYTTKQMPATLLIEIIKRINLQLIIIGAGEQDEELVTKILKKITSPNVLNLVDKLSLDQSALVISKASSIVTGDTGTMHIASAFKIPIISVWGNTHPAFGMYPFLPKDKEHLSYINQVDINCRPCSKLGYKQCPKGHFKCMLNHNVSAIVQNCNSVDSTQ